MKFRSILVAGLLTASTGVLADHNSPMGEGWANMPNDVHNTRVETRESGDNQAFKDFVQYGNGASTVNRFTTSDTTTTSTSTNSGNASHGSTAHQSSKGKGRH